MVVKALLTILCISFQLYHSGLAVEDELSRICSTDGVWDKRISTCLNYRALSNANLGKLVSHVIELKTPALNTLGNVKLSEVNVENFLRPYLAIQCDLDPYLSTLERTSKFAFDAQTRKSSLEAFFLLLDKLDQLEEKNEVFTKLQHFHKQKHEAKDKLYARFVKKLFEQKLRLPVNNSSESHRHKRDYEHDMKVLSGDGLEGLNSILWTANFTEQELQGCEELMDQFYDERSQLYKVPVNQDVTQFVMSSCPNPKVRRAMVKSYDMSTRKLNNGLPEALLTYRHAYAKLLGYESYLDYRISQNTFTNSSSIYKLFDTLREKLVQRVNGEMAVLIDVKLKQCRQYKLRCNESLLPWELPFLKKESKFELFGGILRDLDQYFPLEHVFEQTLKIYEGSFDLKFSQIEDHNSDTRTYQVEDGSKGTVLGFIVADLFKSSRMSTRITTKTIQKSCPRTDGVQQLPVSLLHGAFAVSVEEGVVLLSLPQVTELFAGVGRAVQDISFSSKILDFSGSESMQNDFKDAIAVMLKLFLRDDYVLSRLSRHYQKHHNLPHTMIEAIKALRISFMGLDNLEFIAKAVFDMNIHNKDPKDIKSLKVQYQKVFKSIMNLGDYKDSNPYKMRELYEPIAGAYFTTVTSLIIGYDLFYHKFARGGIMDKEVGRDFRVKILSKGSSMDALILIKKYLGRMPNPDAFVHQFD